MDFIKGLIRNNLIFIFYAFIKITVYRADGVLFCFMVLSLGLF